MLKIVNNERYRLFFGLLLLPVRSDYIPDTFNSIGSCDDLSFERNIFLLYYTMTSNCGFPSAFWALCFVRAFTPLRTGSPLFLITDILCFQATHS